MEPLQQILVLDQQLVTDFVLMLLLMKVWKILFVWMEVYLGSFHHLQDNSIPIHLHLPSSLLHY